MKCIGLIGEPAVGKTTIVRGVIKGLVGYERNRLGKAKWMEFKNERLIVMGSYNGHTFDGTDRLSMACYSDLESAVYYFVHHKQGYNILWEGDRLSRKRWLDATSNYYETKLFHLYAEDDAVKSRRDLRGTKQNESWVKGRKQLCKRLSSERGGIDFKLSSDESFSKLISTVRCELGLPK